jgi:hypothetical protein
MSRHIAYDPPAPDALYLHGTISSPDITQEYPVTFRVPLVKVNGVNDLEATLALVNEIEDRVDQAIATGLVLPREPMAPPVIE